MSARLRVHISPVGFDSRRVTEPLIKKQADKVYLVTLKGEKDAATKFLEAIEKELKLKLVLVKVEHVYVDLWNLYECIGKFREIIQSERGNHVYVNVSTGTKVTAMAGMLACMLSDAIPYYAKISYAGQKPPEIPPTEFVQEPEELPRYGINKPNTEILIVLTMLKKAGGQMRKSEIIEGLEEAGIIKPSNEVSARRSRNPRFSPAKHSRLRAIITPMESEWGFVRVEARGRRSDVILTEQGETAIRIFGPALGRNP